MLLFIIGFMGSGKSYLGKRIAPKLAYDFLDLDDYIEERTGRSISEIFIEDGEVAFRQIESDCLKSLESQSQLVLATGGGTPCFFDNIHWMNQKGTTVFLDVITPILVQRLSSETEQRPLLAGRSAEELSTFITQKVAERRPFYEKAQHILKQEEVEMDMVGRFLEMITTIKAW
ncbi:MAG: shikimate kinase [Bacteroidota bacterium]